LQGTLLDIKADKHIKVIMFCYLVRPVDNAGVQIDCDRKRRADWERWKWRTIKRFIWWEPVNGDGDMLSTGG